MKILFLTIGRFENIEAQGIYTDLLRKFRDNGDNIYVVCSRERRLKLPTEYQINNHIDILNVRIGNITKTNAFEKGISTLRIENQYLQQIIKYFKHIKFDLILYSTPPITFSKIVKYITNRDNAVAYLLLKDIFPHNAVDLKMMKKNSYIYEFFRKKEIELYQISDYIGCMSKENVDYLLQHNKYLSEKKVEICPNSIEPHNINKNETTISETKEKYGIPANKTVFIYGGNLGKPQGIDFLIDCIRSNEQQTNAYFVIAGSGTEYKKLEKFFAEEKPNNAKLLGQLPRVDFENLTNSSDVGLIFLDHRFTIPNFPSRMLSYMQASIPILAASDSNTDVGSVIEQGGFGYWCESTNVSNFNQLVQKLCNPEIRKQMGANARTYLENHYTARHSYEIIMKHFEKVE